MCIRQPGLEEFRIDTPRKIKKKAGFSPNIKTSKHQTRTRFGQVWRFQIFCKETHLLNRNSLMMACLFTEYIYILCDCIYTYTDTLRYDSSTEMLDLRLAPPKKWIDDHPLWPHQVKGELKTVRQELFASMKEPSGKMLSCTYICHIYI